MTRIEKIEAMIVDIPTIRGHVLSMTTMRQQSPVIVRIRFSDGSEGWGEGATIGGLSYGAESPESVQSAITEYIAPQLVGSDGDNINSCISIVSGAVRGNAIARSAVEIALWDGLGQRTGRSIAELFGGRRSNHLPVAWTLASGNSETDLAEAQAMIADQRHKIFKLKIGKRPLETDLSHVEGLRNGLGDHIDMRVDVNQGWDRTTARRGLAALEDLGVSLAEQPIDASDDDGLRTLSERFDMAVMADEALAGPKSAGNLAAAGAADAFAIKVAQSGGLKAAGEVISIARAFGIGIYGGTMLETGLGTAASLQLFSTVAEPEWGTELFGPLLLTEDILTEPLNFGNFGVEMPLVPGIGVKPDPDKLEFFRRDRARSVHRVAG